MLRVGARCDCDAVVREYSEHARLNRQPHASRVLRPPPDNALTRVDARLVRRQGQRHVDGRSGSLVRQADEQRVAEPPDPPGRRDQTAVIVDDPQQRRRQRLTELIAPHHRLMIDRRVQTRDGRCEHAERPLRIRQPRQTTNRPARIRRDRRVRRAAADGHERRIRARIVRVEPIVQLVHPRVERHCRQRVRRSEREDVRDGAGPIAGREPDLPRRDAAHRMPHHDDRIHAAVPRVEREDIVDACAQVLGLIEQRRRVKGAEVLVEVDGEEIERHAPRCLGVTTRRGGRERAHLLVRAGVAWREQHGHRQPRRCRHVGGPFSVVAVLTIEVERILAGERGRGARRPGHANVARAHVGHPTAADDALALIVRPLGDQRGW